MALAPPRRPPPALPPALRNRLASLILDSLCDARARRILAGLAESREAVRRRWIPSEAGGYAAVVTERAGRAAAAVAARPLECRSGGLAEALGDAAALFDAGLYFEVHELLEPYWMAAGGDEREALRGLIQVAVGYQHLASGNLRGARSLLTEGRAKLAGRRLAGLDPTAFADGVDASLGRIGEEFDWSVVPRFPRAG